MATIAIVYGGPSLAVEILNGPVAERGVPVDVDEAVAVRLLEQPTWTEAKPAKAKKENA